MKNCTKSIFDWIKEQRLPMLVLILFCCSLTGRSQTLPGTYTTSWAGNTFAPTAANPNNFMQNWANSMFVDTDGTIYANAYWDEGAKEAGIYKNGQCIGIIPNQHLNVDGGAITANATYVWATVNEYQVRRFQKSDYSASGADIAVSTAGNPVRGLAASSTELFTSDFTGNRIKVFSTSTGAAVRNWAVTNPGPLALDASGNVWVLSYTTNSYGPGNTIRCYSTTGTLLKTITLASGVQGKSIAINKNNNELYVTDIGPNMQIHIYGSINGTPSLIQSFGTQGGILAGTKGLVANLKFNVPNHVGIDGSGNLIIWSNGNNTDGMKAIDGNGLGTHLESYTRAGVKNWEILGLHFVDMGTFDPASDGLDFYTKHEHFTMDYSQPDGQQWTYKGFTLNRDAYPNDDRMLQDFESHGESTTIARRVQGKLFLYMTSMYAGGYQIYRFDQTAQGEIAIPCGTLSQWENLWIDTNGNGIVNTGEKTAALNLPAGEFWAQSVDKNGTIWMADITSGIRNYPVQSINSSGVPVYSNTSAQVVATPAPFQEIFRMDYDQETDAMYLSGYTQQKQNTNDDWGVAGRVLAKYPNWSTGNRTAAYTIDLPYNTTTNETAISFIVEGDYIFVVGVTSRGKVWVYNTSNGALAGTMIPGSNVGGIDKTGWCDLRYSVDAFKRSSGEYLVTVEEDFFAKVLIYRWNPGTSSSTPTVTTTAISAITPTSASSGGNVTNGGSSGVTARGVCWSTSANPTTALTTKTVNGSGTGSFTSAITGLVASTTYHVRAYATNSVGTSYGSDLTFTTSSGGGGASLTSSVSINTNAVNLTSIGTADWKHFRSNVRKSSGSNSISNPTVIGGSAINYTDDARAMSWTGGTPTATGTNVTTGKYKEGVGNGFSFTAPAGNGVNTLYVYVGGWNSSGTLTAHLSNSAAPDYVNTTSSYANEYDAVYTITYNAGQTGQTLTVTWKQASGSGNVTIQAAALGGGSAFARVGSPKSETETLKSDTENQLSGSVSIYPNPATNFVTIDFNSNLKEEHAKVEMIDLLGRKVYDSGILSNVSTLQISTSSYPKGNYVIRIKRGAGQVTKKLMIE